MVVVLEPMGGGISLPLASAEDIEGERGGSQMGKSGGGGWRGSYLMIRRLVALIYWGKSGRKWLTYTTLHSASTNYTKGIQAPRE